MADIEKVIKGLECCLTKPEHNCEECPYEGDEEEGWPCKSPQMKADALELLQEKPTKPKQEKALLDYQSWYYVCGNCENPIDIQDNFCRHCGRPIEHT